MIQVKCIEKYRDNQGRIYGYKLVDINGQTQDVKPDNLKQAIANKQIHVVNLTLTSDNRLVDTTEKQLQSKTLGSAPKRQPVSSFEKKCMNIISYICKEAHIGFNNSTYEYKSKDKDNESVNIFSKEITKLNAKLKLSINKETYRYNSQLDNIFDTTEESHIKTNTQYTIKIDVLSDNLSYLIRFSSNIDNNAANNAVKFINEFKSLFENINSASSLLKAADFLTRWSDEAPEMTIESLIESLENAYGISTHVEIQRRIDVITSNGKEMDRIRTLVRSSGDSLMDEYDVDIDEDECVVESYIRASIYYEALFSSKVSDIYSVHILKYEAKKDLDYNYKI